MGRLTLDGVPGHALARRWGVPQAGVFRRLGSSLDAIHDLGAQEAPAGTAVVAEEQTAGRGRGGRRWHSPAGGVWLGMLFRPRAGGTGTASLGAVAIRAGLVLADVVDEILGRAETRLKWPNDVLLADRKLAGILCEGRWQGDALQWLAVGVGVNVCNPIARELAARAIALEELVPGVRRIDVLDKLVPALVPLVSGGGTRLSEAECQAFVARDWLRGRLLRQPVFGRAWGVSPEGALLVDSGSGTTCVREGHVELA